MNHLATSSHSYGSAGSAVLVVCGLLIGLSRAVTMFRRYRGGTSPRRWPYQAPGGAYGRRSGPDSAQPGGTGSDEQGAPLREQDHSYWEPEQEDGTLSPDGYIGDPGETTSPADSG